MMTPIERYDWIEAYLRERGTRQAPHHVSVRDRAFTDAYSAATGVQNIPSNAGAQKYRVLGLDLSRMYFIGRLSRHEGKELSGVRGQQWVYIYRLVKP